MRATFEGGQAKGSSGGRPGPRRLALLILLLTLIGFTVFAVWFIQAVYYTLYPASGESIAFVFTFWFGADTVVAGVAAYAAYARRFVWLWFLALILLPQAFVPDLWPYFTPSAACVTLAAILGSLGPRRTSG